MQQLMTKYLHQIWTKTLKQFLQHPITEQSVDVNLGQLLKQMQPTHTSSPNYNHWIKENLPLIFNQHNNHAGKEGHWKIFFFMLPLLLMGSY